MNLTTKCHLFAFHGAACIALVSGCNQPASQSSTQPSASAQPSETTAMQPTDAPVTPPAQLAKWLEATPNRSLPNCALEASEANPPNVPFFVFGQNPNLRPTLDACFIDGPYPWGGKQWYVMRIKGSTPPGRPKRDLIKICSEGAIRDDENEKVRGPCGTQEGAGPYGCEVCVEKILP